MSGPGFPFDERDRYSDPTVAGLALAGQAFDQAIALESARAGADAPAVWLLKIDQARWLQASGQQTDAAALAAEIRLRLSPMIHPQGRFAVELAAIEALR